jgi:hypothetical protein
VRDRLLEALVLAFRELKQRRSRHASIEAFTQILRSEDSIITTNWDTLLDSSLIRCTGVPPAYGTLGARLVNAKGKDLKEQNPPEARLLLKLHGSFNWQHCPRCANLYINTSSLIAPTDGDFDDLTWLDRKCHCGAEMDGLIVTPSFVKRYSNLHLANIWKSAQQALGESNSWIFVGYSLPDDDLWIRGMLLRAVGARRYRGRRDNLVVHVVTRGKDDALERRYRQLFPERVKFHLHGLQAFVEAQSS